MHHSIKPELLALLALSRSANSSEYKRLTQRKQRSSADGSDFALQTSAESI